MKTRTNRSGERRQLGQSMVEVALALPVFLILIAGVVEVSNLLITKNRIDTAARASTRFASAGGQTPELVAVQSVTDTLDLSEDVWDIWIIKGTFNEQTGQFSEWSADAALTDGDGNPNTQSYGIGNTEIYSEVLSFIGDDCVSDPPAIDLNDPDANFCLRDQTLATLFQERPSDNANHITNLDIVGTFIIHDIDTILGLEFAFPNAEFLNEDVLSAQAFNFMRTTSIVGDSILSGCPIAFPIAMDDGLRALTQAQFEGFTAGLDYGATNLDPGFFFMAPDANAIPLNNATERHTFWLSDASNTLTWLRWNRFIAPGSATLANSLAYPGDISNYADATFRGYAEVADSLDRAINVDDQVAINDSASISDPAVQTELQAHIDRGRTLRIILHPASQGPFLFTDGSTNYHFTSGFAIVRLLGYSEANGGGLLVEFIRIDTSCGRSETNP